MTKHHIDELEAFANTLIKAAEATTPGFDSPGTDYAMVTSYWLYSISDGYSSVPSYIAWKFLLISTFRALGWVNHRRAETLLSTSPRAALERFKQASADYVRAADVLNEDEEYHAREPMVALLSSRLPLK